MTCYFMARMQCSSCSYHLGCFAEVPIGLALGMSAGFCIEIPPRPERDQTFGPAGDLLRHSCADPSGRCQCSGEWRRGHWGETGAKRGASPPLYHQLQSVLENPPSAVLGQRYIWQVKWLHHSKLRMPFKFQI